MENILEIRNLTVTFRSRSRGVNISSKPKSLILCKSLSLSIKALDSVSFSLERGKTTAIVGESGSGKSTLLRAILSLIKPDSAEISIFGKKTGETTPNELNILRRRCGYIPQDPYGAIPPGLSVVKAVEEPEIIAGIKSPPDVRRKAALSLLSELGLNNERILNSRAVSLSGGQRQRVEIARALMLNPELLLCDEPTSMQDASTRSEITDVLKKRIQKGMSMLFVTHDLLLAAGIADKIIVLKNGRICEEAPSQDVLSAPKDNYTKELLNALPKITY